MKLCTIGSDAKTVKGEAHGYLTCVLYLAPSDTSGVKDVCPWATRGCKTGCLATAGRMGMSAAQRAQVRRTRMLYDTPGTFWDSLCWDIDATIRKADRDGLTPVFRLNGTSDLPWCDMPVHGKGQSIVERYGAWQFYDYTKSYRRMKAFLNGELPRNYHLTYSRTEDNEAGCLAVLESDGNVAMVFDTPRGADLPTDVVVHDRAFRVIDGDLDDLRFHDPRGVVVGLRAKGRARKDTTGFVIRT